MNFDETMRRVVAGLDAQYADYDLGVAREDLENRLLAAESTDEHAQQTQVASVSGVASGTESAESEMPYAEVAALLVAVDVMEDPSAEVEGWGPRLPSDDGVESPRWTEDWRARAACRDEDVESLFVRGAEQRKAKLVCLGCPVRTECLATALDNRIEYGVWGGMTERERRALLRRRPDVLSWWELLDSARHDHGSDDAAAG